MSLEDLREELKKIVELDAVTAQDYRKNGFLLEIKAQGEQVEPLARAARQADYFLESITAVDFTHGPMVVYQFNSYKTVSRIRVKVPLAGDESIPTISHVYDAALWYEREVFDFFGIHFDNHPDLRRLLLPEDADFYPLLKDYGRVHAFRSSEEIYDTSDD